MAKNSPQEESAMNLEARNVQEEREGNEPSHVEAPIDTSNKYHCTLPMYLICEQNLECFVLYLIERFKKTNVVF